MPALIALITVLLPIVLLVGGMVLSTNGVRKAAIARERGEAS